jgi:hypothetical protein
VIASELLTAGGQAALAIIVAVIGFLLNKRSKEIQVNVDGRLTTTLEEVGELKKQVGALEKALVTARAAEAE